MKLERLGSLHIAPGEATWVQIVVTNDGSQPVDCRARVLGLSAGPAEIVHFGVMAPGASQTATVPLSLPKGFPPGTHQAAVEVFTGSPPVTLALEELTLHVGSVALIVTTVVPATLRGHRRARFTVELDNRRGEKAEIELAVDTPEVTAKLQETRVTLNPGERRRVRGQVRASTHVFGDPVRHPLAVTTTQHSRPSYTPAVFEQLPLLSRPSRNVLVSLAVVAGLLVGALGLGVVRWVGDQFDGRGGSETAAEAPTTTTAGDGDDGSGDATGVGADGTPTPVAATTTLTGTLEVPNASNAGVTVQLEPVDLTSSAPTTPAAPAPGASRSEKLWPVRSARVSGPLDARTTRAVEPKQATSNDRGTFELANVAVGVAYELSFVKDGFDRQSIVVVPERGQRGLDLSNVVLEPASGLLAGLVSSTDGPVGGAEVTVSDGTLTYVTSTQTGGDQPGRWELSGVTTPADLTVVVSRPGYGDAVTQVSLAEGGTDQAVNVTLEAGVAAISGRVTGEGRPLGGVTITAAAEDVTRTTSSLSVGDVGFFLFPGLPLGTPYVVTASAPGYLPASRQETAGSGNPVTFELVRATGTIVGTVASSAGGGLADVGVVLSADEPVAKTLTAADPPGRFVIGDLPPGTYRIGFTRYDHDPQSQVVEVTAGRTTDLGTITLARNDKGPVIPTARVVVQVVNSAGDELGGATVKLVNQGTGAEIELVAENPEQFSFEFEDVPIGVYRVFATNAPLYREARGPRFPVGLAGAAQKIQMFKLGKVSGIVRDSFTKEVLRNYAVRIQIFNGDGEWVDFSPPLSPRSPSDRWESDEFLPPGRYRVVVESPPEGYQVLDQVLLEGQPVMEFQVALDDDDPILLNDLLADKFPNVRGRVFFPLLLDPVTNTVGFPTLEAGGLDVVLRCPDAPDLRAKVSNDEGQPAAESYAIDYRELKRNGSIGKCSIVATADGFPEQVVELTTPLAPSDGTRVSDQTINVVLFKPGQPVGGRVYWVDRGLTPPVRVDADGVPIATTGTVITGFEAAQGLSDEVDLTSPNRAVPAPGTLLTRSEKGAWRLEGQIFGRTGYLFSDPRFVSGTLEVTEDGVGPRTVTVLPPPGNEPPPLSFEEQGGDLLVQLDPRPTTVAVEVDIDTKDPVPSGYGDLRVTMTPPGEPARVVSSTTRRFEVTPAEPGTWQASVSTVPAGHVVALDAEGKEVSIVATTDGVPGVLVEPTTTPPPPLLTTRLVELAELRVRPVRTRVPGSPAVVVSGATIGLAPALTASSTSADGTVFRDVPVDLRAPLDNPLRYRVDSAVTGYDVAAATLSLRSEGEGGVNQACTLAADAPAADVLAGSRCDLDLAIPRYGIFEGFITSKASAADPATRAIADPANKLRITAYPVDDTGTPDLNSGIPATLGPCPDRPAYTGPDTTLTQFCFTGVPGRYVIEAKHESHVDALSTTAGTFAVQPASNIGTAGVWALTNDNDLAPSTPPGGTFAIVLRPGTIALSTVRDTEQPDGGTNIQPNVSYRLVPLVSCPVPADPCASALTGTTGTTGSVELPSLPPGDYWLELERVTDRVDQVFPLAVAVTLPAGVGNAAPSLVLRAPLPTVGLELEGTVVALNSANEPLDLPASAASPLTVTRSFDPPPVAVGASGGPTSTIPNTLDEGDLAATCPPSAQQPCEPPLTTATVVKLDAADAGDCKVSPITGPDADPVLAALPWQGTSSKPWCGSYRFEEIAAGAHELSLTAPTGYTLQSGFGEAVVTEATQPSLAPTAILRATDVSAVITVTGVCGPLLDATVTLLPPGVTDPASGIAMTRTAPDTFYRSVRPVPPRAYTVHITHPLYGSPPGTAITASRTLGVDTDGNSSETLLAVDISAQATRASFSGDAKSLATERGNPAPLEGVGTVTATPTSGTETIPALTVGTDGRYTVVVGQAVTYSLRLDGVSGFLGDTKTTAAARLGCNAEGPLLQVVAPATWTITVLGDAVDAGLRATLVANPGGASTTISQSGRVFTVAGIDPRVGPYEVKFSATEFLSESVKYDNPEVGGSKSESVTLNKRNLNVTVTTDDNNDAAARSATLKLTVGTVTRTLAGNGTSNLYTFLSIPEGTGTLELTADGYLTTKVDITERQISVDGTVAKLTARVISGTITGLPSTAARTVTLTASGATTPLRTDPGTGPSFSFSRVPAGTYTVAVDAIGYGVDSESVSAPAGATTQPAAVTLVPVPRDVTVTVTLRGTPTSTSGNQVNVTVTSGTSTAASGPVDVGSAIADPPTPTTVTLTVKESPAITYTVASTGTYTQQKYRTLTGSLTYTGATVTSNLITLATVPLTLVDRPTITGAIKEGDKDATADTVSLFCVERTALPDTCADPLVAVATLSAVGSYSFTLDTGDWRIDALSNGPPRRDGSTPTISVGATDGPSPASPQNIDLKAR